MMYTQLYNYIVTYLYDVVNYIREGDGPTTTNSVISNGINDIIGLCEPGL